VKGWEMSNDRERRIRERAMKLRGSESGARRHNWEYLAQAAAEIDAEDAADKPDRPEREINNFDVREHAGDKPITPKPKSDDEQPGGQEPEGTEA
jgi:hypothetical protein